MSFDDIKIHAATAIAKSGDATYMNFVDFMNIHLQCPYGFAQLCSFKRLADLNTFEMDAITVRIVELIPILTFKEYLKSFLFEPCLTIPLVELFNAKSCKEHYLFTNTNAENINHLDLLSCKATIRNLDDCDSTIFSSNDIMKNDRFNLPAFLNNPTTAFFMPEKSWSRFGVHCSVPYSKWHCRGSPFSSGKTSERLTWLRGEVLDCLKSKYYKASELSWIHFLVVFPTETNAESKYTIYDKSRPKRTVAVNFNDIEGNVLFIVINPSNAKHFYNSNQISSWRSKREIKKTKLMIKLQIIFYFVKGNTSGKLIV
ncbi:unnamed protein product [Rhizophagus irregularis]|nr:unnamed protein product [Rhizophagus irregularis]